MAAAQHFVSRPQFQSHRDAQNGAGCQIRLRRLVLGPGSDFAEEPEIRDVEPVTRA